MPERQMGFVHGYTYDIFISYCHVDNKTPLNETRGWVDCFEQVLKDKLAQRVGERAGERVEIWRDSTRLEGNFKFNESIEKAICNSALLISLTSPSNIKSPYCELERKMFVQHASHQELGLSLGERYRIFNVLMNNIPVENWPKELGQGREASRAFELFERVSETDGIGRPSKTSESSSAFDIQMDKLVATLGTTLKELQIACSPSKTAPPPEMAPEKQIFVAEVPASMRRYRRRLVKRLKEDDFQIITDIPPPDELPGHDRAVVDGLAKCGFSIHLLDKDAGEAIEGVESETYPRRQANLALEHGRWPFIWVPRELDISAVTPENYQSFLSNLEKGVASDACFCRGISPEPNHEEIFDQVLRSLETQHTEADIDSMRSAGCVVDYHEREDVFHVSELTNFLFDRGIQCRLVPQADHSPEKGRRIYEARIRRAAAVIVLFGRVTEAWVDERLRVARQHFAVKKSVSTPHFIVCAFPPKKETNKLETFANQSSLRLPVHVDDHTQGFAPNRLTALLDNIGIGGAS
jgi:hypothetical protein